MAKMEFRVIDVGYLKVVLSLDMQQIDPLWWLVKVKLRSKFKVSVLNRRGLQRSVKLEKHHKP